jgi:hypothetical protein
MRLMKRLMKMVVQENGLVLKLMTAEFEEE